MSILDKVNFKTKNMAKDEEGHFFFLNPGLFFLKIYLFIYLFGCIGSSLLCEGFL